MDKLNAEQKKNAVEKAACGKSNAYLLGMVSGICGKVTEEYECLNGRSQISTWLAENFTQLPMNCLAQLILKYNMERRVLGRNRQKYYEDLLSIVLCDLDPDLPMFLSVEEQGEFLFGLYKARKIL